MGNYSWEASLNAAQHDNFYVDGSYVVYSTGEASAANINNLAFVYEAGRSADSFGSQTFRVKVLLADGTKGTYVLNKNSGVGADLADSYSSNADLATALNLGENGAVFTYSLRDNTITLRNVEISTDPISNTADYYTATAPITFDEGNDTARVNGSSYATNDSSYFFVVNTDSTADEEDQYAVIKASELTKDIITSGDNGMINSAGETTFVAQRVGGFNTLLAGVLVLSDMPGAAVEDYYFVNGVASASYTPNADDQYEVTLPVITSEGESTLVFKFDDDGDLSTVTKALSDLDGRLVEVELDSDGSVDVNGGEVYGLTAIKTAEGNGEWHTGTLTAVNSGRTQATISGNIVTVDADANFFVIDNNGSNAANYVSMDEVVYDRNTTDHNVVYLTNDDGDVVAMFMETDAEDLCKIVGITHADDAE